MKVLSRNRVYPHLGISIVSRVGKIWLLILALLLLTCVTLDKSLNSHEPLLSICKMGIIINGPHRALVRSKEHTYGKSLAWCLPAVGYSLYINNYQYSFIILIQTEVADTNAHRCSTGKRNELSLKGTVTLHLRQTPATWEWQSWLPDVQVFKRSQKSKLWGANISHIKI